ncbi:kinase-like domain-containing protein [Lactarius pseudohatsudake]|nr:kinase-like domain-containing protein [Lactarius pseudohatsudake]
MSRAVRRPTGGGSNSNRRRYRCGQMSGVYVPRRSSPDDGGSGGDGDSLVLIPFPRAVSGEYGGASSSSPFNTPLQSQSPSFDPVECATSNERGASLTTPGNVDSPSSLLPRGRFQSEVDGANSRRRPRLNSYDGFGAKPRRSRFESVVNLGVASGEQASASDLMVRDGTKGSVSRQTLVARDTKAQTHFTLKAFGKLNEKLVASYVFKILEGLDYLHRSDVVHCDLKAANILTTKTGNVKLSDFGVSLNLRAMEREIKDVAGTPNWTAPEVIELKGASPKSDIWSLGCTVIELLTGRPPYGDIGNAMTVMFRIVEDESPPIPERFSGPLVAFLKECFHKDPNYLSMSG